MSPTARANANTPATSKSPPGEGQEDAVDRLSSRHAEGGAGDAQLASEGLPVRVHEEHDRGQHQHAEHEQRGEEAVPAAVGEGRTQQRCDHDGRHEGVDDRGDARHEAHDAHDDTPQWPWTEAVSRSR